MEIMDHLLGTNALHMCCRQAVITCDLFGPVKAFDTEICGFHRVLYLEGCRCMRRVQQNLKIWTITVKLDATWTKLANLLPFAWDVPRFWNVFPCCLRMNCLAQWQTITTWRLSSLLGIVSASLLPSEYMSRHPNKYGYISPIKL